MTNTIRQDVNILGTLSAQGITPELASAIYKVGAIYISTDSTSPASFLGGTWERIQDKFLLSAGSTYSAGSEGGSATHTLTVDEMPTHDHTIPYSEDDYNKGWQQGYIYIKGRTDDTTSDGCWFNSNVAGGNLPHNNMPPYLAVYMWKRVA